MFAGVVVLGIAAISVMPVYAQVYGPDGKELPPVSDTPPAAPAPQRSSGALFGNRTWRFGVTAGGFFPIGALSDRSAGNVWPSLALSYEIKRPGPGHPYTLTAFAEGMATSRRFKDEGNLELMNEVRELYGVGLEARGYLNPGGPVALYLGGGAGSYFLRRGIRYDTAQSPFLLFNDHTLLSGKYYVQPGFKLMLGVEEKHGIFAELRFLDAGVLETVRYQGFSANIGGRF
jgi:hypothetical protein